MKTATTSNAVEKRLEFAKKRILPAMMPSILADFGKEQELLSEDDNTLQTDIDAENACIDEIEKRYKKDSIFAEERHKVGSNFITHDIEWVIDPLDGSTNYKNKSPLFTVSIAIRKKDKTKAGLVYHPMSRSYYHAIKGKGAYLNNTPLHVSKLSKLDKSRVSLVSDNSYKKHNLTELREKLENKIHDVRKYGCTSLELACVAAGMMDGVVKPSKNPWGVSAGLLLVEEAGGKVTTYTKGDLNIHVASNPYIHDSLCDIVKNYLKK